MLFSPTTTLTTTRLVAYYLCKHARSNCGKEPNHDRTSTQTKATTEADETLSFVSTDPHNNGQWCKKVRGRVRFLGVWEDPDAALQRYLSQAADLHAGREAQPPSISADGVTVKQVVNHYLAFQIRRAESKEIGVQWFENCRTVLESLTQFVGGGRLVSDLRPDDFQQYRQRLATQGLAGRGGLGVHALNRAVTVARGMLKYAYEVDLVKFPVEFGKSFARPSATLKRKSQQACELANGKRLFDARAITKLINAAEEPLRAMILLGINGGLPPSEFSSQRHLVNGVACHPVLLRNDPVFPYNRLSRRPRV